MRSEYLEPIIDEQNRFQVTVAIADFIRGQTLDHDELVMPDTPMDGFEALNIIMNDDKLKNIPLVVMSASESNDIISDCLKRGATNFLVKPIRLQ